MIGDDALVPPTTPQPLKQLPRTWLMRLQFVSYRCTPLFGSATADTSATVRRAQAVSGCHGCLASYAEQPLPAPLQAVSLQPRAFEARPSVVPPTAVTNGEAAGYSTP